MVYNVTFVDSPMDMYNLISGINQLSSATYTVLIIFSLFLLLLVAMKRYSFEVSLIASSFICTIISALFWAVNLFPFEGLIGCVVIMIGSIIIYMFNKN